MGDLPAPARAGPKPTLTTNYSCRCGELFAMGGANAKRAVIVEDDDDIRGLLEIVLGQMGFDPVGAVTGEQGIESVRDLCPELVTLDIGLPGVDGLEVLAQLREFHSGKVVVVSARGRTADAERALAAGADGYLVKPFRPKTLREDLERIINK